MRRARARAHPAPPTPPQVKWELKDEDTGDVTVHWWPATVASAVGSAAELLYCAHLDFDPESATVEFNDDGCTLTTEGEEEEAMLWKFAGGEDPVADDASDDGAGAAGAAGAADNVVSASALAARVTAELAAAEADAGASAEAVVATALGARAGSAAAATEIAARYAAFSETMGRTIRAAAEAKGEGEAISADDVRAAAAAAAAATDRG
jgi:hypothetical protein